MSLITYPASFDGNDLTTVPGLTVLSSNPYVPAHRKLNIMALARTNKSRTSSAFYDSKQIILRVGIARPTRALLDQSVDTLLSLIQGQEKTLQIQQSGGNRNYTATYSTSTIANDGGSYMEIQLLFETSDHFGYDAVPTQLLQVNNFTSGQSTNQLQVAGSAPFQAPIITLTYGAITSSGSKSITIGNNGTGQSLTITRTTWANGDIVIIDALNQSVKVNGTEVAFTGAIPEFAVGVGYIAYSDQFTARTFGMNIIYYKRYV